MDFVVIMHQLSRYNFKSSIMLKSGYHMTKIILEACHSFVLKKKRKEIKPTKIFYKTLRGVQGVCGEQGL